MIAGLLCLPHSHAFLENASVQANSNIDTGSTSSAAQNLSLSEVFPGSLGFGSASSSIFGPMTSLTMSSSGSITSTNFQNASNAISDVTFADQLTLEVPGLPPGTTVLAKIAFDIEGTVSFNANGEVLIQASSLVQGPQNSWQRQTGNTGGPFNFDDEGTVEFIFPIQVGETGVTNVELSATTATSCARDPLGDPLVSFSGNASANLGVDFVGITDVTTVSGIKLFGWTADAGSNLDYGEGDPPPPPPAVPLLTIAPSIVTPGHLTVAWEADPTQSFIIQSSTDGLGWFREQDIFLQTGSFEVDPAGGKPFQLFRIVSTNVTGPPATPVLTISPSPDPDKILLSWEARIFETYRILAGSEPQNLTEVQAITFASGPLTVELSKSGPIRFFGVEASLTVPEISP